MKTIHFYIILLLVGISFSCKKKTYPESTFRNEVVYYFKGNINNSPVTLEAGKDNYYMFSSITQDNNGVYNFLANLQNGSCTNTSLTGNSVSCVRNGLQIQINDFKVSDVGAPVKVDSSLKPGLYPLLTGSTPAYAVKFKHIYNKSNAVSFLWDFGDGTATSTQSDPTHTYQKSGKYNVCLTITGANGCVSTICNEQKIGLGANTCKTYITAVSSGNTIAFTQNTSGAPALQSEWNFGDGLKSTQTNPQHPYQVGGARVVTLKVTDINGDVAFARYNAVTANDPSSCAANYEVTSITTTTNTVANGGTSSVIVRWVDENGKVYSSESPLQPASSYFEIQSVVDSETNEHGQKTKKLQVRFKCMVYNGLESVLIDTPDMVVSVAYK